MSKASSVLGARLLYLNMPKKSKHKHTFTAAPKSPRLLVRVHSCCRRCGKLGRCPHHGVLMVMSATHNKQVTRKLSRAAGARTISLCKNVIPET